MGILVHRENCQDEVMSLTSPAPNISSLSLR
jgi:hypothetical protein